MSRLLAFLVIACVAPGALAQPVTYPAKSIRLIVPAPSRTPLDHVARIVGRGLADAWDQPVVVDNRAAGNGAAGQEMVAGAQPDGHTLLMQSNAYLTLPLFHKLAYDTERDFTAVARIAASSLALVVHPSLAAGSVKELLALARKKPGTLAYASNGNGSNADLAGAMLRSVAAIELAHTARRDETEALGETMSGRTQMMFLDLVYALPHVESGALRALAATGRTRSSFMPDLPTLAESGVAGYEFGLWIGAFVPAGTPAPVTEKIAQELARFLESPGANARLLAQGYEGAGMPMEEFQRFLRSESQKFSTLVKKGGTGK